MTRPAVTPVDLSGGASTIGRDSEDEMTTGEASVAKAYAGGFTADPHSPSGRVAQTPLMVAYQRYLRRLQAAKATETTPAETEARAHRKGLEKAGKALQKGHHRDAAFARGFATYKKHGGKLGLQTWVRKCAR